MKSGILILLFLVSCAKESSSKKSPSVRPVNHPDPIVDIVDPLDPADPQRQTEEHVGPLRPYNGQNVVISYASQSYLGMIRIRGKDSAKLHKHMALATIKVASPHVKSELEAKVGKHVHCRPDACWIYIDFKNGDVKENGITSRKAKAPKIILTYQGKNLHLQMFDRLGKIFFEGEDAKALYSAMAVPEIPFGGKGIIGARKIGGDIKCERIVDEAKNDAVTYKCAVKFNHRTGSLKTEE